ncbi:MAG: ribose-5-phosphate isomerase [Clostridia bacterium BRH_c25]|nr:MAG: ribose-5-phosphate isomerase [Clostridia bacterium BRH_c25]
MKIALGSDHVGYAMKMEIVKYLEEKGYECVDFGPYGTERADYPVYALKVANAVASGNIEKGILICGTGVGISIAANKVKGIRAVVCSEPYSASFSRLHNNTNILAFGARVIGIELAKMIVGQWLNTEYEGGRHQNRIDQIAMIERGEQLD